MVSESHNRGVSCPLFMIMYLKINEEVRSLVNIHETVIGKTEKRGLESVSYTHLDVYKRQE